MSKAEAASPNLVVTANPNFVDLALEELMQGGGRPLTVLAPGVQTAVVPDYFTLAEQWRRHPPIFARHICPIQLTCPLTHTVNDIQKLTQLVQHSLLDLVDPTLPFSVQTRLFTDAPYKPFDLNQALAEAIAALTQAPLDVRAPQQILSLVTAEAVAYLGLSLTRHNLSAWAGGVRRLAWETAQISRAEFKLLEALELFQVPLPPRGFALDLGAAPGGWTRVLRQREQYVTAVDPAHLHPSLQADPNVRHKRMAAEAYLADDPDQFDLIVNDMRLDARDSARLMVNYAPYLYPSGQALMTFKLPEEGRHAVLDHTFNILKKRYTVAGARQLFHNRSEITVYLHKK